MSVVDHDRVVPVVPLVGVTAGEVEFNFIDFYLDLTIIKGFLVTSVKNSSNGLNFTKKRAKNRHFFSQKTSIKRAKLQNSNQKNGCFQ